jgi:ABC-2 type transport system ATP-binding protein
MIVFDNVSKFYGEVLGVNRVTISIGPGITSLVGPNGSGKTTLMNLWRAPPPTEQRFDLRADAGRRATLPEDRLTSSAPTRAASRVGCRSPGSATAADAAPPRRASSVGMMGRPTGPGYSKGMKQRIKLAQSIAHDPEILVLDEPLNGLDPLARAETIDLFRTFARAGRFLVISSHVLHEVGPLRRRPDPRRHRRQARSGSDEMAEQPLKVLVLRPAVAPCAHLLGGPVVGAAGPDKRGVLVRTERKKFYLLLNRLAIEGWRSRSRMLPADGDVRQSTST